MLPVAAKVRWIRGRWYVVIHRHGQRTQRAVGPEREVADRLAASINRQHRAQDLGGLGLDAAGPLPLAEALRSWLDIYSPTLSRSWRATARSLVERQLSPELGGMDLRALREADVVRAAGAWQKAGVSAATTSNALNVLRRVLNLAVQHGSLHANPVPGLARIAAQIRRQSAKEVRQVNAWTRAEVEILLGLAREREPALYPPLVFLLTTGSRRGEALGLQWQDVDLTGRRVRIRRGLVRGETGVTKGSRARDVVLPDLAIGMLRELLSRARSERPWDALQFVFLSPEGFRWQERNFHRSWTRLRRRAADLGVRPLHLHCARHTYATLSLEAGWSVKWVAEQLGHASPELTLRTYVHVLRDQEPDLSHLDFGSVAAETATKRRQTATVQKTGRK